MIVPLDIYIYIHIYTYIYTCIYGCFLKWWYPQKTPQVLIICLVGKLKGMVVGETHHFRKPPYVNTYIYIYICISA